MYQPTLDHASTAHVDSGTSSISWSHQIGAGAGRYLVVAVQSRFPQGQESRGIVNSLTYNGVQMTQITNPGDWLYQSPSQINHQRQRITFWKLDLLNLPAPGTYTITANFAGTVDWAIGLAASFFNVKIGSFEAFNITNYTSPGGTGSVTTNITTATPNAIVIEITGGANGTPWVSIGAGQTLIDSVFAVSGALSASYRVVPLPTTVSMRETNSNAESLAMMCAAFPFTPSPSGILIPGMF